MPERGDGSVGTEKGLGSAIEKACEWTRSVRGVTPRAAPTGNLNPCTIGNSFRPRATAQVGIPAQNTATKRNPLRKRP